ncbi:type VI secretion system lysozyme-like protein [Pseudomonas syringae pv. actinidiae ICMP 18804]|nr:type VI secretion system lysozyme-like protein [Pseudomonas syringae pv. actinidiae ICMP 18804]EPN14232.1 type VI secretion system lysozyme-like protein [Pseudomonas syringae pv. actinidiae ICMP 19100]EPN22880.1 type VI secretion system lysozyme-like protein [Pseudomonas syringae pv. actinidiae ICMP 19099]EPN29916.1 type VI secretion system lysozyme-like protein [Pseudomonas syringae pv. actinidiae ICMP 18883]EPN38319.1 type VI secretion system lysozyme-like protein [Pseudomonas syringae pv.
MNPSLYEMLLQNFDGELDLYRVREEDQYTLSVLDNLQRILSSRAGSLSHLPEYGLPDPARAARRSAWADGHAGQYLAQVRAAPGSSEYRNVAADSAGAPGICPGCTTKRRRTSDIRHDPGARGQSVGASLEASELPAHVVNR